MTLNIAKNVEHFINEAVQSGRYTSADEMIARLVEDDARRAQGQANESQESSDKWALRLESWVNSHSPRQITLEDSRETIYGGRGE